MQPFQPASNVIHFDSTKLQSTELLTDILSKSSGQPKNLAELYRHLNQKLQTTLELEQLLSLFFEGINQVIIVDGLHYRHEEAHLELSLGQQEAAHAVCYRLQHQDEYLGELSFRRSQRFEEHVLHRIEALLRCILFPLRNAVLYRLAQLNALRDPLTGAGNRVAMEQTLAREIELSRRYGQHFAILMLDLDNFKQINDRYGHPCGDQALKSVVRQVQSQLRSVDVLFRFGGEEFLVLLSNSAGEEASVVAQHLCDSVQRMQFIADGAPIPITISVGGTAYRPPETLEELLCRADKLLYQAKHEGRNRACITP